jgi:hypothetical protein
MSFADQYLIKHKPFIPTIEEPPSGLLSFIIVIPVYLEDKILVTLENLKKAYLPKGDSEVLMVVNYSETDTEVNKQINLSTYNELLRWSKLNSTGRMKFYPLLAADLPPKHAGAGLARKIGMDQALRRFNQINNQDGLILSLDADTLVERNYFQAIEKKMIGTANTYYGGCIINFEHPIEGNEYERDVYEAIIQYELHLRYYKYALKFTGFPFYHYTIGSCFGVRAGYYAQQGGMNRKKGGEDFYFLHKLFPHKPFVFISETCVYPSPRPSTRVPFGTGPVITKMVENKETDYFTYSPQAFLDLKEFLLKVPLFFNANLRLVQNEVSSLTYSLQDFLKQNNFEDKLVEIRRNSASEQTFLKRFYQWFDGFMVVKFLNFSHASNYKRVKVTEAIKDIFARQDIQLGNNKELLLFLRLIDKKEDDIPVY